MYDNKKDEERIKRTYDLNLKNINTKDVEMGEDITILEIPKNLVQQHKDITGYTGGLITRDLVKMGEEIIKKK